MPAEINTSSYLDLLDYSANKYIYSVDSYDQDKLGLGPNIILNAAGGWVGPTPMAVGRPMEASTAVPAIFPFVIKWSSTIHWIFLFDNAAAAATRRVVLYEYDITAATLTWKGYITLTYPAATNHTIRGVDVTYDKYTVGTVSVSGTAVTGTNSLWVTDRMCVGCRIGFGSTDPTQIAQWYEISAIGSNTGITLAQSAGTIAGGTAYVIEDLRILTANTNATATNGGLYLTKGIGYQAFTSGGTTIPAATTTDLIRAVYWLADASTVTNTTAAGCDSETKSDWITQNTWVLDGGGTANAKLFKYNSRKALTLTSGKDTTTLLLATGTQATTGASIPQINNGVIATLGHGPGSGLSCFYFVTTGASNKIYRTNALSTIVGSSTTFLGDSMAEIPTGSTTTFPASTKMIHIEYDKTVDRLIITTDQSAATTLVGFKNYYTQYKTDSTAIDRVWGFTTGQQDQSTADSGCVPWPNNANRYFTVFQINSTMHAVGSAAIGGSTAQNNHLYVWPISADQEFQATTNNVIVTPRIATTGCIAYDEAFWFGIRWLGSDALGLPTEPFKVWYRTTGISDNSGAWTLIAADSNAIAGAADYIQFKIAFRTMGSTSLTARLQCMVVTYRVSSTDTHFQLSVGQSDLVNKKFAWRFSSAFGGTVPKLYVRLYDATSGATLLTDDTVASAYGTWDKSTNGGTSYGSYNTTDKGNETTYIRYTPSSLANNINVRPVLSTS